jgi:hypothetical protein
MYSSFISAVQPCNRAAFQYVTPWLRSAQAEFSRHENCLTQGVLVIHLNYPLFLAPPPIN